MRYGTRDSWYDVAQICLNGHLINSRVKYSPVHSKEFCDRCGVKTISNCPKCKIEIQGDYRVEGVASLPSKKVPKFCHTCGHPFPWMEAKIQAAHDLAQELENVSEDDKKILTQSIDDIVKDTPKTTLAATSFKRILAKTGKPVVDAFRDILVDIASETAKKLIWP